MLPKQCLQRSRPKRTQSKPRSWDLGYSFRLSLGLQQSSASKELKKKITRGWGMFTILTGLEHNKWAKMAGH